MLGDYSDRKGYEVDFLQPGKRDGRVFLPMLSGELAAATTRLTKRPSEALLRYHHYTVVMHRRRRLAIYSAANVDFNGRFALNRPKDVWRFDPRIPESSQTGPELYADNQFDRGHLTRREDLEYGKTTAEAQSSAADTCHWTNCTPQHARFNEGRELWQGIERHILEEAVDKDRFRAQVITGPVLAADDPLLPQFESTPYPVRYWKVVAAINAAGQLFATAYILDQTDTIKRYGLRGAPDVPFTPYKTYQTTIASIEKLNHLSFTGSRGATRLGLVEFDPLARRHLPAGMRGRGNTAPIFEITRLDQIQL